MNHDIYLYLNLRRRCIITSCAIIFPLTNTIWTDQLWSCPTKLYNILIGRGLLIPASQKRVFFYLYRKLRKGKICWQILKVWLSHSDFCKSDVRYLSQRKQQRDRGFTQLYGQKFYCPLATVLMAVVGCCQRNQPFSGVSHGISIRFFDTDESNDFN